MKLPFNIFKKSKTEKPVFTDELILVLDIGTELLKTLMFRCSDLGVHILKSSRVFQQRHAMKGGVIRSLDTVIENCQLGFNEVTNGLEEEDYPKKVVMGVAGELVHGVSIVVNYDRDDRAAKEVSLKEQNNIYNKVKENVLVSGKEELSQKYNLTADDIEILNVTITGVEIGGMSVNSLVGFTGRKVQLHFYASFAPKTYLNALRNVAKGLNLELVGIVYQPFAMARVLARSREKDFSGIFVDIGGGTTDLALVQNGNIVDTQVYAFGGRVITKRIASDMNLDYRHAESRKLKYSRGELDDKISKKVKTLISKDIGVWVEGLHLALSGMEDVEQYPAYIYLCGGGAMLPDLRRALIEYPWTQKLNFMRFPKVSIITPEKLDMVFDKNAQLKDSVDVTPAALSRFVWDKIKHPSRCLEV